MAQVRLMGDDAEEVGAVLEMLLRACTGLVVGHSTELSKRGPGRRIVFELLPTGPGTVRIERLDDDAPPPPRPRRARELPRGRT